MKISILGAGTWGCALARLLSINGHEITLWSSNPAHAAQLQATGRHPKLPDAELPESIAYTTELADACREPDILLFVTASNYIRSTAAAVAPYIRPGQLILSAAKGVEAGTLYTMSQVIEDAVAPTAVRMGAVSGPTHAEEVSRDMPTAMVGAAEDMNTAELICQAFSSASMRMYPSDDLLGVELCGAFKNIIALAAGIARGLGCGDNALAALITRGMAEVKRLGKTLGCRDETFEGLAGVGDLIVTCSSRHSRNMNAGLLLGQGIPPAEAIEKIGMVVEGIHALDAAMELAEQNQVRMPITQAVNNVVHHGASPKSMLEWLMTG